MHADDINRADMFLKATVVIYLGVVTLSQTSFAENLKDFNLAPHGDKRDVGLAKASRAYKDYGLAKALQDDDEDALAEILQDDDGLAESLQDDDGLAEILQDDDDGLAEILQDDDDDFLVKAYHHGDGDDLAVFEQDGDDEGENDDTKAIVMQRNNA